MYTLQGKTRSTRHMLSTLDSHMVPDHTSLMFHVGNLSLVPTRMKQAPTPWRSLGDLIPLPHDSLEVGEGGFSQEVTQLLQLTRPITPACDWYIQYLLTGANPLVVNQLRWGL
jgi:hypothetical protein